MSYYYGDYYGEYAAETTTTADFGNDEYYGDYYDGEYYDSVYANESCDPWMQDCSKPGALILVWGLVPVLDLAGWYYINDKLDGATSDEWELAMNVSMGTGVVNLLTWGASLGLGNAMLFGMSSKTAILYEFANLYLTYAAQDTLDIATVNSGNEMIVYGLHGAALLVGLAAIPASGKWSKGAALQADFDEYYGGDYYGGDYYGGDYYGGDYYGYY